MQKFKQYKIPTFLGLLLLLLGTGVSVYLVQYPPGFLSRAEPGAMPSGVKITNISENSFSVSWITQEKVVGFIQFGETPSLGQTASDDRDQIFGTTGSFQTHHITLKNLKPQTKYFFKIGSGAKTYDESGKPYEITTAPVLSTPPLADPAYGSVFKTDGGIAEGAIVYLSLANTTPLSALVSSSGNWVITLNNARSKDLSSWTSYDREASTMEIFVQAASLGVAQAITTTANDSPVPNITLGKTYDFRKEMLPEKTTPEATPSSKFTLKELAPATEATSSLAITNPSEGENVNTQKPAIAGTGPKDKTIQIIVESPLYQGTVLVNQNGEWAWTSPSNLSPGEHTVKVSYGGQTITRKFTVLAAGTSELPAFTATPSATITPTRAPTPTPTRAVSPTPTATPSARTAMPATGAGVPTVGYLTPTFLVTMMGVVLILFGLVLKARFLR